MKRSWLVCAVLPLIVYGCKPDRAPGCTETASDCPGGHVCESGSGKCQQICEADAQCPPGLICDGGTSCVEGTRANKPQISDVSSDGSLNLADCEGGDLCLGGVFIVSGSNLTGAQFKLVRDGDARSYELNIAGAAQDSVVHLRPAVEQLDEGIYRLSAINAAGDATSDGFRIMRGEKGDDGAAGVGTPGLRGLDGPAGPAGSGTITKVYSVATNGTLPGSVEVRAQDEPGRIHIILKGLTNKANAVSVPQNELELLCGDADGCNMSIAMSAFHACEERDANTKRCTGVRGFNAPYSGPSCRVFFKQVGANWGWTVGPECLVNVVLRGGASYRQYLSYQTEIDGNGTDGVVLLSLDNACLLTEAPPEANPEVGMASYDPDNDPNAWHTAGPNEGTQYATDTAKGLSFIAAHPSWNKNSYPGCFCCDDALGGDFACKVGQATYPAKCRDDAPKDCRMFWDPADAQRECRLTIED